tara:strand:- start:11171 stop:11377 length:207 start_codon:yes stop_codon:yes gene_type:complete
VKVGDLVLVNTYGWDKDAMAKYNNRAGVITHIDASPAAFHRSHMVDFGEGSVLMAENRLQLITGKDSV